MLVLFDTHLECFSWNSKSSIVSVINISLRNIENKTEIRLLFSEILRSFNVKYNSQSIRKIIILSVIMEENSLVVNGNLKNNLCYILIVILLFD